MRLFTMLGLLLTLNASCAHQDGLRQIVIPPELSDCAYGPKAPLVPPTPRTVQALADFANANTKALEQTRAALAKCRDKLLVVIEMIKEAQQQKH